jgi:DNA-binding response OmpR family regulator
MRPARTGEKRSNALARPRVLVINDDSALRNLIRISLGESGCDVLLSAGSPEVLAIMQKDPPDLVILDLTVHGVDGLELCRQICQTSSSLIAFNLWGTESDLLRCLEMGADDYLGKPFGADELTARVWAILRRKRLAWPSPPSSSGAQISPPASDRIHPAGYYTGACVELDDIKLNRIHITNWLKTSIPLSLAENWESSCTVLLDRPLSAAYWGLEEITGEGFLNELDPLQVEPEKVLYGRN